MRLGTAGRAPCGGDMQAGELWVQHSISAPASVGFRRDGHQLPALHLQRLDVSIRPYHDPASFPQTKGGHSLAGAGADVAAPARGLPSFLLRGNTAAWALLRLHWPCMVEHCLWVSLEIVVRCGAGSPPMC